MEEEWDIDSYRGDHESDEHWTLRREFMETNKSAFPKNRLLALSQVFANHEFMGCRYPEETMATVAELSTGIVEGYRAKQKSRLQRTFVKASAAAEAKSKRVFNNTNNSTPSASSCRPQSTPTASSSILPKSDTAMTNNNTGGGRRRRGDKSKPLVPDPKKMKTDDITTLVLVEFKYNKDENPISVLHQSCDKSGKAFKFDKPVLSSEGQYTCSFIMGDFVVEETGTYSAKDKNNLRRIVAEKALNELKKLCYTVQIHESPIDGKVDGIAKQDVLGGNALAPTAAPVQADNVGNRLMRLMGYAGGGLGKTGQGIEAPIDVSDSIGRQRLDLGLGPKNELTHKKAKMFLSTQLERSDWKDLIFSPELKPEERATIHSSANSLGLKSQSRGKEPTRYLVVSKKLLLWDLLQDLLNSGNTSRYQVIPPSGNANAVTTSVLDAATTD